MFAITVKFLEAVQRNNNTDWLHANYDLYQQEKKRFENLVSILLTYGQKLNLEWKNLTPKQCIFRFNRDIRYRVDKKPYKDHFGFEFASNGKRSGRPCFYFELRPGASFVGVGTWRVGTPFEHYMRKYAILHFDQRKRIQNAKVFKSYFGKMRITNLLNSEYQFACYKSMYCLKKAFPEGDFTIDSLQETRKELRTTKCSYQKAWEILRSLPLKEQIFYRQLCFQKDRLWQHKISDDLLLSEQIVNELKNAMSIAMPLITFLQQGI